MPLITIKRVLCPQRLRRVPVQFSWIDHRLVRHRHISRCSHPALALYLFLVTVCDGEGLSYWSDARIGHLLHLEAPDLARARQELIHAGLIAYQPPLYQVLALDPLEPPAPTLAVASRRQPPTSASTPELGDPRGGQPLRFGQILRQIMEKESAQ